MLQQCVAPKTYLYACKLSYVDTLVNMFRFLHFHSCLQHYGVFLCAAQMTPLHLMWSFAHTCVNSRSSLCTLADSFSERCTIITGHFCFLLLSVSLSLSVCLSVSLSLSLSLSGRELRSVDRGRNRYFCMTGRPLSAASRATYR